MELADVVAQEHDLQQFLTALTLRAAHLLEVDRCSIFIYDEASNSLWSKVAHGLDNTLCVNMGEGIVGQCALNLEAIMVNNAYEDDRFLSYIDRITGYTTKTILAVPLIGSYKKLVGVFQLLNKREGYFTHEDRKMAQLLTTYVSVALENALLHDTLKQRFYNKSLALVEHNRDLEEAITRIKMLLKEQDVMTKTTITAIDTATKTIQTNLDLLGKKGVRPIQDIFAALKNLTITHDNFRYLMNARTKQPRTLVNISELVRARAAYFSDIAISCAQKLNYYIEDNIYGNYHTADLERIVDNTISNAINYSTDGSTTDVYLRKLKNTAQIKIIDRGYGIIDKKRIFERGYREYESIDGFGMGLNLVNTICSEEQIKITIEDNKPHGTVFIYDLFINAAPTK
jgi:signal transduction histidine kinase